MTEYDQPIGARVQGEDFLETVANEMFVVDPRDQGFGLRDHKFLDGYANKFFLLAGSGSVFISPASIPAELLEYYDGLGLEMPSPSNIITVPSAADEGPLEDRILGDAKLRTTFGIMRGGLIVPYMLTPSVESLAAAQGLSVLADSSAVERMADKAVLQRRLSDIGDEMRDEFGFDVAIPALEATAGDRGRVHSIYNELSRNGTKDVVVIKPKSASALGVFILRAARGVAGLAEILDSNFSEQESVLLEEYVEHDHSPSMQGSATIHGPYKHHYFGRQFISMDGEHVSYDGNQIPFGPKTVEVDASDMRRLEELHLALGERLVRGEGISGIAGLDMVLKLGQDGHIETAKITEMNLHLPGSMAVYGALRKLFPDGFDGIAHNIRVPLVSQTPREFLTQNADILVAGKGEHGVFPINMSYTDKVDVVLLARDKDHLAQLIESVGA